jgi:hypothetical protein
VVIAKKDILPGCSGSSNVPAVLDAQDGRFEAADRFEYDRFELGDGNEAGISFF